MPAYRFRNKETNEQFDAFMTTPEVNHFLEENSHIERVEYEFAEKISVIMEKAYNQYKEGRVSHAHVSFPKQKYQ